MTTPMSVPGKPSWLEGFKKIIRRRLRRRDDRSHLLNADDRPITSQEAADQASEDSFPASDPPSYTGSIT